MLTSQVELDDYVFFTSVELLNKSLELIFEILINHFFLKIFNLFNDKSM